MEVAALDGDLGPAGGQCAVQASSAIDDDHLRWDEAFKQRLPGDRFLAVAPLPAHDESLATERYQEAPALEVGPVEHDDVVDDTGTRGLGHLDVPAPQAVAAKRSRRSLREAPGQDPGMESGQLAAFALVGAVTDLGRTALLASPTSASSTRLPVLDLLLPAYTTARLVPSTWHSTCSQSM